MIWKKWSYWLKGGILIFIPVILLGVFGIIRGIGCIGASSTGCMQVFATYWRLFLLPLEKALFFLPKDSSAVIVFPLIIIYIFAIGAILGLIYEKITKKNKN